MEDAKQTAEQKKRELNALHDLIKEKEQDLQRLKCLALEKEDEFSKAACQALSETGRKVVTDKLMQQIASYCKALRMERSLWLQVKEALLHQSVEQQLAYLKRLIASYKEHSERQASSKRAKVASDGIP